MTKTWLNIHLTFFNQKKKKKKETWTYDVSQKVENILFPLLFLTLNPRIILFSRNITSEHQNLEIFLIALSISIFLLIAYYHCMCWLAIWSFHGLWSFHGFLWNGIVASPLKSFFTRTYGYCCCFLLPPIRSNSSSLSYIFTVQPTFAYLGIMNIKAHVDLLGSM